MTTEQEPDERLWELDVNVCDDGDILLRQGTCPDCGDDVAVRLHRSHLPLLAEHAGMLTAAEHNRATEHYRDRLGLLAAMVSAHCPDGHPLRAAAAVLVGEAEPTASPPPAFVRADDGQLDLLAGAP